MIPAFLTWVYPDIKGTKIELRALQEFPPAPANFYELARWPKLTSRYINDHFILRSFFIHNISKILYSMNISISKQVIFGRDDWLFFATPYDEIIDKYRGIKNLSPGEAEKWIRAVNSDAMFLKHRGVDFFLIIIPNKCTVYPQFLPPWCKPVAPSLTETLIQKLRLQSDFPWIDLRPVMKLAAETISVYGKFDTHWNDKGAYIAYHHIMKNLPNSLKLNVVSEQNVQFSTKKVSGDLARKLNLEDQLTEEKIVADIIHSNIVYRTKTKDYSKLGWAVVTKNNAARAVILCDSFVESYMAKYLQESFSSSFFKHHNCKRMNRNLILEQKPDIVLYLIVERLIPTELTGE